MTNPAVAAPFLRPLSIGELLDRAVTLFVRNFWLFCGLSAIVYVPFAIVQSFAGDFWASYAGMLGRIFTSGAKGVAVPPNAAMLDRMNAVSGLDVLIWIVAAPLATAALTHAAGKLVSGEAASFRGALRFALHRWGAVLLFGLLWIVLVGVVFIVMYLGSFLLALLAAVVLRSVAIGVILGILVLTAWIAVMLLAFVAGGVGFATLIVEPGNALRALAAGLERAINRTAAWRSMLIGLVYAAIVVGFSAVSYAAGLGLLFVLHTGIPLMWIASVMSLVQFGFSSLIIVLYYFDLRARREGADLVMLASQLTASQ